MSVREAPADIGIRAYRDDDEAAVLDLLTAALGGGPAGERSAAFFRWKHLENPFGPSYLWVAEAQGRIVGLRAFMRWRFVAGERSVDAVRAVDTATHPDFQRRGVFSRLTSAALETLRWRTDLVFNTPNERSGPGYLKLGWRAVGRLPVSVRVRRPVRFARRVRHLREAEGDGRERTAAPEAGGHPAADVLRNGTGLASLLEEAAGPDERLSTARDPEYLRWRYGSASGLGYRAVTDERGGRLRGLAFFRVRPRGPLWESTVSDVVVPHGDRRTAARLLRRVAGLGGVDHLTCRFATGTTEAAAARRAGYLPSPVGPSLVVNPLRPGLRPDPTRSSSWALALGDLEAF